MRSPSPAPATRNASKPSRPRRDNRSEKTPTLEQVSGAINRAARLAAKLTHAQLAARLGMRASEVAKAETTPDMAAVPEYFDRVLKACKLPDDWVPPQSVFRTP